MTEYTACDSHLLLVDLQVLGCDPGEGIYIDGLDVVAVKPEALGHSDVDKDLTGEVGQFHLLHQQVTSVATTNGRRYKWCHIKWWRHIKLTCILLS